MRIQTMVRLAPESLITLFFELSVVAMQNLAFTFCYDNELSSESLGKKRSGHSKTLPLSISLDMINTPQKSLKLSMKSGQLDNVTAKSSTTSLPQLTPRSFGSHSLREAIGSKMLQRQNEEASRFLIGTFLRPTAFVENGFVIGSRGIEKAPGYYHHLSTVFINS